jgi:hypothetical protein
MQSTKASGIKKKPAGIMIGCQATQATQATKVRSPSVTFPVVILARCLLPLSASLVAAFVSAKRAFQLGKMFI